jgi:RNA polymerase sigma factor (sigma-70 family)
LSAAKEAGFMGDRRVETALRDIDALFRLGVVSGMSDGQLLERFAARSDSDGQLAFETIVRRHGPMVLGVCLRALGDFHSAEDAFQATFMVLSIKSRAIRKSESLGPWLHGVAVRIARRRLAVGRRGRGTSIPTDTLVDPVAHDPGSADVNAVIDEELGRLPDKYRLPVVLCYLEGQTQDEAARALGWTKGTVSGRLARAKDLLRHRLTRRGLAPSVGLLTASLTSQTARAAVPPSLLLPTVRAATAAILGSAETGLVTGQASALAREAMKLMLLGRIGRAASVVLLLGIGAAALATPMLLPSAPAPPGDKGGGRANAAARAIGRPRLDASARLDQSGDPLPPRAVMRLGTIQRRHTRAVAGIDFTRNGRAAVTVQTDGLVRFWDADSGRQLRAFDVMTDASTRDKLLRASSISADGALMAAAGFALDPVRRRVVQRVWIWDLEHDQALRSIEVPTVDLFCVAFAPDGAAIATGGFAGAVQLWEVATGECLRTLKLGNSSVGSISFTPDGKFLAACEEGKGTRLYDLPQGRETFIANPQSSALAPVFSPDGRLMAVNSLGGEAVLWDRVTAQKHLTVPGVAIRFAPDSRSLAVSGSDGGTLLVVDTETGSELCKIEVGWGPTRGGLAFSPNGQTIITERGGTLRFFDTRSGRERLGSPEAHQGAVSAVQYTPDGRAILTAGDDGTVRLWDAATSRQLKVFPLVGRIIAFSVSPNGSSLATATQGPDASVSVWDLATGTRRQQWPGSDAIDGGHALAFSSDSATVLAFDDDHGLRVLEIATGDEREAEQPRFNMDQAGILDSRMSTGVFSPGNRFLAIGTATTTVRVADLANGLERLSTPANALAFSSDGQSLAVATPGKPEMSQLADGSIRTMGPVADGIELVGLGTLMKKRFAIRQESVTALALSPAGKVVAVAGGWTDPVVRTYRTEDGRELGTFACPAKVSHGRGLAFSPDGRSLAAGLDDTTIVIWNIRDVR